ncbi:MAG: hypothetical protein BA867_09630 [Desulfobacterales bacterium S5133MH16]|nr:MAG: hypothetical protein BA867_09630 [Desulfobacterales bacterium S5133MH16]
MKTIRLTKAGSVNSTCPEEVHIIIADDMPKIKSATLDSIRAYYDTQAQLLVDALILALPQGTIEPLLMRLMEKHISLYVGVMATKKEN